MDTVFTKIRVFSHLRLATALLFLVGFWVCAAQVELPEGEKSFWPPWPSDVASPGGWEADGSALSPEGSADEAEAPSPAEAEPTLVLDAGHGGADGGTAGNGLVEKDWTLKVVLALAEELRNRGHKVTLTRDSDVSLTLIERALLANAAPRIALLSIHFNAGSPDASGIETWYSWPKKPEIMAQLHHNQGIPVDYTLPDDGQQLARAVQSALRATTGARDRGFKNSTNLAITSSTLCPSVLIECGFLSNGPEKRKIQDLSYRKKLVEGIANGYEAWRSSQPSVLAISTGPAPQQSSGGGSKAEQ